MKFITAATGALGLLALTSAAPTEYGDTDLQLEGTTPASLDRRGDKKFENNHIIKVSGCYGPYSPEGNSDDLCALHCRQNGFGCGSCRAEFLWVWHCHCVGKHWSVSEKEGMCYVNTFNLMQYCSRVPEICTVEDGEWLMGAFEDKPY